MLKNSNSNNLIEFSDVSKVYKAGNNPAVKDISFSVASGEFVCLIGPSGCGKSTILKLLVGIEEATSGHVIRPENISMDFQSGALLPWLSVYDNVAFGLRAKGISKDITRRQVDKYISMMGLENFVDSYPADLSGGQRQRVGIARALAVDPAVLLLDEPFSSLDPKTTAELHEFLLKVWKSTNKTIVMVSHLIEEAVSLANRVILIKNGSIDKTYEISLPFPRREQEVGFSHDVMRIRRDFFI